MAIRILLFLGLILVYSCQSSSDSKGENIPSQTSFELGLNPEKNIQFLTLQLEDQPNANLYFLRAKNYYILHAYGLADQDIEKALRENPGEPAYLALSARIKQRVEDYATSIDRAKLVEVTAYNSPQNELILAQNFLATNQMSLGRLYLRKINVNYLNSIDHALYKAVKDFAVSDSLRLFHIIDKKPADDSPLVYLYFEQGLSNLNPLRVQQELLISLKKYPMDPLFMRYWARFLVKMKKYKQAASVYKQVLKVFPRTKSLTAELLYFDLARQGKLPVTRTESSADSISISIDSTAQN
jgi:tetratricopeptide (TPR) repeat protein